jgi:putative ABC transport system permease protein
MLKRLRSHALLTALFAFSLALCIGLLASPSLFADAVSQAIMRDELAARADAHHRPTFAVRFYAIPHGTSPLSLTQSEQVRAWLADYLGRGLGLPVRTTYVQNESPAFRLRTLDDDPRYAEHDLTDVKVAVVPGIGSRLETVAGVPYGATADGASLRVWLLSGFAEELGLDVGEKFRLSYPARTARHVELEVAGIVRAADPGDEFWYQRPDRLLSKALLTTEDGYNAHVAPLLPEGVRYLFWYFVFDDSRLNLTHADRYISVLKRAEYEVAQRLPGGRMDVAPLEELLRARERKRDLTLVLTALTVPMIVILTQFLVIVSSIYARSHARHDATVISRGASSGQVLLMAVGEIAVCLIFALPLGLALGVYLARLLGCADGFVSFTIRDVTPIHLAALDWQPVAFAVVLGGLARLWATGKHAKLSVVAYERMVVGRQTAITGLRVMLLALLGGVTLYAYRQLVAVGGVPLAVSADAVTFADPLLLLAPSLFLLVVPLALAEATSLLLEMVAGLSDPILTAPALVAFRQLARDKARSRAPVFVLVTSLALGVFYASLAYSSQIWTVDRLRHLVGADLAFDHAIAEDASVSHSTGQDAWYLPAQEYEEIAGVERATRVFKHPARTRIGVGSEQRIQLIGIERLGFPEVAYFRDDYAPLPLGDLMNRLALHPEGALVPQTVARERGVGVGDSLVVSFSYEETAVALTYEIVGTYDYFPSVTGEELAVVVNIESVFEGVGQLLPHSIWLRTSETADERAIMREVERRGVVPTTPRVLAELVEYQEGRREYVGALGMMSVSFLASLVVAAAGTLLHLFAGLVQQGGGLALLRGIGFRLREVIATIALEYALVISLGIGGGAMVGLLASRLYGRYLPLTAPTVRAIPPFLAYSDASTTWWMVSSMLITSLGVLVLAFEYLKRQRVFEVLRLG